MATLRAAWNLGEPFTAREAAARPFEHLLSLEIPRAPETWPDVEPLPVPPFQTERVNSFARSARSGATCAMGSTSTRDEDDLPDPPPTDPKLSPALAIDFAVHLGARLFPRLVARSPAD